MLSPRSRWAFTLTELLVALLLLGVVGASVSRLLLRTQRVVRGRWERAQAIANLRVAAAIIALELRTLDATDAHGGDLLAMSDTAITYRAMRSVYLLCRSPSWARGGSAATLVLAAHPRYGRRTIDPARDDLLIYAEGDPSDRTDNQWVRAAIASRVRRGRACPGREPSLTLTAANAIPSGGLTRVTLGAPVRGFEVMQLGGYRDSRGDWWLGARHRSKSRGWTPMQPIVGPLAPDGVRFVYWEAGGSRITTPSTVARVGVSLAARKSGGVTAPVRIATQVALRNNRQRDQ